MKQAPHPLSHVMTKSDPVLSVLSVPQKMKNFQRRNKSKTFRPSLVAIIKSRRMRWEGQVERMGEKMNAIGYWWESQREGTTRKTKT
jgi:hypothetical protein